MLGRARYVCTLLMVLVLLSSCSYSAVTPSSTPSPSPTKIPPLPTSTPIILTPSTSPLSTAPQHCPTSPPMKTRVFPNGWGGYITDQTLVGDAPVWANYINPGDIVNPDTQRFTNWPATKIIWEVGPNYHSTQPITVRVTNLSSGELAPWDTGEGAPPPTHVIQPLLLDHNQPSYHGSPESGWQEWGSILYLFKAGCYAMDVTWQGGHWRLIFSVGR